jgi:hypothetical protein
VIDGIANDADDSPGGAPRIWPGLRVDDNLTERITPRKEPLREGLVTMATGSPQIVKREPRRTEKREA